MILCRRSRRLVPFFDLGIVSLLNSVLPGGYRPE